MRLSDARSSTELIPLTRAQNAEQREQAGLQTNRVFFGQSWAHRQSRFAKSQPGSLAAHASRLW